MAETLVWWCVAIAAPSFFALSMIAFVVERSRRVDLKRRVKERKGSRSNEQGREVP